MTECEFAPFSKSGTYIFSTIDGYGEGKICKDEKNQLTVQWVCCSQSDLTTDSYQLVNPAISHPILSIATDCTYASNYFHPGFYENTAMSQSTSELSICSSLSGLCLHLSNITKIVDLTNSVNLTKSKDYQLTRYLRIHNLQHQKLLEDLFNLVNKNLNCYLHAEISFSDLPFDRITWLLSTCLYIDGFSPLPKEIVIAILQNFLKDYNRLSSESWIRSPCNYLFDYHRLQGIQFNEQLVIFVPPYELYLDYGSNRIIYSGVPSSTINLNSSMSD